MLKKVGTVMADGQYRYVVTCLVASGICCLAAAIVGGVRSSQLRRYQAAMEAGK